VEHLVPMGLLLLSYALLDGSTAAIVSLGAVAVVGRVAISIGILRKGAMVVRSYGAYVTYLVEALLVGLALVRALSRLLA
ncbi:MAG: MAPEG family protein, partial [Polyangiaceae bacterium]|nr:MAPEG family protein [Polyangiaceae bacterium]